MRYIYLNINLSLCVIYMNKYVCMIVIIWINIEKN